MIDSGWRGERGRERPRWARMSAATFAALFVARRHLKTNQDKESRQNKSPYLPPPLLGSFRYTNSIRQEA